MSEKVYIQNECIEVAQMGDELAMLNVETGTYIAIDEIGRIIWEKLDGEKNIEQIVTELLEIYEVDWDTCIRDIDGFLEEMYKQGVVTIK